MNKSESKYFNTATKMDLALISLLKKKPFEYITVSEIGMGESLIGSPFDLPVTYMICYDRSCVLYPYLTSCL